MRVLIAKKYTNSYYGNYVISASYLPANDRTELKGVEIVETEAVRAANCRKGSEAVGSSFCVECQVGYKLVNRRCVEKIDGCLEYYGEWCVRCGEGRVMEGLSECRKVGSIGSELTTINDYLIAMSQSP